MCMYVYVCMYMYISILYVCIYVCISRLKVYVCVCMCMYVHVYIYVSILYVCMYVCMHVCMCVYIRRHHLYEYFFICKALELGGKNSNVGPGRSKFKDQSWSRMIHFICIDSFSTSVLDVCKYMYILYVCQHANI